MLSRSNSRSLTSFPLNITQLFSLVFLGENASFFSYQRGKIKMAYLAYRVSQKGWDLNILENISFIEKF